MTDQSKHLLLLVTENAAVAAKVSALCRPASANGYSIKTQKTIEGYTSCDALLIANDKKYLLSAETIPECAIIYLQNNGDTSDIMMNTHIEEIIDMNKITQTGFVRAITSAIEKFHIKKELHDQKLLLSKLIDSTRDLQKLKISPVNTITTQSLIEENKQLIETVQKQNEELKMLSRVDALTKVSNRLSFEETLSKTILHARRHKHMLALLMIDLDKFKNVNDTFGHQVGDILLQMTAQRLQEVLRKEDFIARLGGDEFAIILNEIENTHAAGIVSWKISQEITKPFVINGAEIRIDISIGIACYPLVGETAEDLVKNADVAMYQAKKSRITRYMFASIDAQHDHVKRIKLEEELKTAIQCDELRMVYQPIYETVSKRLHGFEALIRWENKHLGKISPAEFIPIAEDSGLIHPISKWVLDAVCKQIALWKKEKLNPGKISINLSPAQLSENNLTDTIKEIIKKYDISLDDIEFEITEMAALQESDAATDTMKNLSELGISHALDNFGMGYSSMRYLKFLPVTTIKIAQGFVKGLGQYATDEKIVSSIIALAKTMKLQVVAEGVETEQQLHRLMREKCDYIQGFLFSKPLSVEQAEKLLRNK